MTTIVRFNADHRQYAVPVDHVTEVCSASDLTPLPESRAGVAGLMRRGDDAITVLSMAGARPASGEHIIVLDEGGLTFGLLVDEVTGVQTLTEDEIGRVPPGQDRETVVGVFTPQEAGDEIVLVLDCAALRGRLS